METTAGETSEDQPTLYLLPEARSRLELARADAELEFRASFAKLVDEKGTFDSQETDEAKIAYAIDQDLLVIQYAHTIYFAFAREATCGLSDVWIARRALQQLLPRVINEAYEAAHPFAKDITREEYLTVFFPRCDWFITNCENWRSLHEVLREHAQIEIDSAGQEDVAGNSAVQSDFSTLPPTEANVDARRVERRALRDSYRAECKAAGFRLTDQAIAEAVPNWSSRTQVQKWLDCDPRYDGEADRLIRKVFSEKPHLRR